jgi:hypothetical protein
VARRITFYILLAMILGIIVGFVINQTITDPTVIVTITDALSILTGLFLKLIKMIIAPLVFATLVGGIAHMGDRSALGRLGARAIGWFLSRQPGIAHPRPDPREPVPPGRRPRAPLPDSHAASGIARPISRSRISSSIWCRPRSSMRWRGTRSCRSWSSRSSAGVAASALGEAAAPIDQGRRCARPGDAEDHRLRDAPRADRGVRGGDRPRSPRKASASSLTFGYFMGGFYIALIVLWALLFGAAALAVGGSRARICSATFASRS